MYPNDIYTVTANVGVFRESRAVRSLVERLPIGFQLIGPYWSEPTLLKLSHGYEQARPFLEQPPISAS